MKSQQASYSSAEIHSCGTGNVSHLHHISGSLHTTPAPITVPLLSEPLNHWHLQSCLNLASLIQQRYFKQGQLLKEKACGRICTLTSHIKLCVYDAWIISVGTKWETQGLRVINVCQWPWNLKMALDSICFKEIAMARKNKTNCGWSLYMLVTQFLPV